MYKLKTLRIWILFTVGFFIFLFISPFVLPMGYTTLVFSLILIFSFLGVFCLEYVGLEVNLLFNDWVYDVEGMDFLFNPMFITWLYATDRKRWIKWMVPFNAIVGILIGMGISIYISWNHVTQESFLAGSFFSILLLFLFSFISYNLYIKWLEIPEPSEKVRKKLLDQVRI